MKKNYYSFFKWTFSTCLLLMSMNGIAQQIYSNGSLSTGATSVSGVVAASGYTWSEMQTTTGNNAVANTNLGYSCFYNTAATTNIRLADDFIVPAGQTFNITSFDFYCYQTSYAGTVAPIDGLRIQIWNGDPQLITSTVVAGDMTTNVYSAANSSDALMYRIANSLYPTATAPGTARKLWKIRGNITASLPAGTYWVVYQGHTTDNAAFFCPPVTAVGSRGLAGWNAKQYTVTTTTWAPVTDGGNPATTPVVPQDMPFIINGTIVLGTNDNQFSNKVALYPNPAKNTLTISDASNSANASIEITDISGRIVKSLNAGFSNELVINVSELTSGNYILKLKSENGTAVKKFIKM